MRKVWKVKSVDEARVIHLADTLHVPPLIARLLVQRGFHSVVDAENFLCSDLNQLSPPNLMADLPKAIEILQRAIEKKQKVLLAGDYDVDGLTSTALLYRVMRSFRLTCAVHIPHRVENGYGLKLELIEQAARDGIKILVTLDCGTTSFAELARARELGIETIVVDHHELLPAGRPPADAFLNPLQPECRYPSKGLASVGVAFTLARGLLQARGVDQVWDHLDLVALGTVADLAPLVGENRILVKDGLHVFRGTRKPGLRVLLQRARIGDRPLVSEDISFTFAPRINAMGRLGSALESFRLLVTDDADEATTIAQKMDQQNKLRRAMERDVFRRALAKVERTVNFSTDRVIVVEGDRWHVGVVGIVATQLAGRFHRPSVVIGLDGSVGRGSARSVGHFSLVEAFEEVKEHLLEFGGHAGAVGLTIDRERIPAFREALNRVAHQRIDPASLAPSIEVDAELPLTHLTDDLMRDIEMLAPFGRGNPRPVFASKDARIPEEGKPTHFNIRGISFSMESSDGRFFEALQSRKELAEGFNFRTLRGQIHVAYSPIRHFVENVPQIELNLRDVDPCT